MGYTGLISGVLGFAGLALLFQMLVGIGGVISFFNKLPWYILFVIILVFTVWLLKKK